MDSDAERSKESPFGRTTTPTKSYAKYKCFPENIPRRIFKEGGDA